MTDHHTLLESAQAVHILQRMLEEIIVPPKTCYNYKW